MESYVVGLVRWMSGAALLAVAVIGGACGDDGGSGVVACTNDDQCSGGTVCDSGKCAVVSCQSNGDCLNGNQACIDVTAGRACSVVECGCPSCGQCPLGETCNNGTCGAATACSEAQPCTGTDICDGGSCRACVGAECPTADCTTTGCSDGKTCNPTTKQCETPVVEADACGTCETNEDCGDGWKCAALPTGRACLPPCSIGNDCETGWTCQAGNCTPVSFRCEGCVTSGCSGNEACNPSNNTCIAKTATCGSCGNDWECGAGNACRAGACAKRCEDGACPDGGSCTQTASGVSVCQTACEEQCTPACGASAPICHDGACVQCLDDGDCSNGQTCDTGSNTCAGTSQCTGTTPILWQGTCVQCTDNSHCGAGETCNQGNHTCGSGQCASCAAPYPACVQIGEDSYCVQCAVDEDCGLGGVCNTSTYACEGGSVTPTEKCQTDADCDSGASGYTLHCDQPSGYCWSEEGSCDDVTAFCVGSDGKVEKCVSLLEIFGGGGALPEIPGGTGGDTIPGFCGCSTSLAAPLGNCRTPGAFCLDFAALLAALGGGGSTPGSAPNAVCFALGL